MKVPKSRISLTTKSGKLAYTYELKLNGRWKVITYKGEDGFRYTKSWPTRADAQAALNAFLEKVRKAQ